MVFNLTSLVKLLNRLFGTKQTTIRKQSASLSDYGIFYTFKNTGAILELRSSLRDGIALWSSGTAAVTLGSTTGQYQYTPYGYANLSFSLDYELNWATLAAGGLTSTTIPVGGWVNWTKIANTDDNHSCATFDIVDTNPGGTPKIVVFQYFITNRGVGVTITATSGTLPTTGVTRLALNVAGISLIHA
jgi:hypothetical protein